MRTKSDQHLVKEDGTVVSHMRKPVIYMNRENLAFIIGQKEDTRQSLRVIEKNAVGMKSVITLEFDWVVSAKVHR